MFSQSQVKCSELTWGLQESVSLLEEGEEVGRFRKVKQWAGRPCMRLLLSSGSGGRCDGRGGGVEKDKTEVF